MKEYWSNMTLHEEFSEEPFNIVVTLTDTAVMQYAGKKAAGLATEAVCFNNETDEQILGMAISHDLGSFEGILVATHELGHILGITAHDDDLDDDECDPASRFIMSSVIAPGRKNLEWSPCSLNQLSSFLRSNYSTCYDTPADPQGDSVQRVLPGDVWGPHQQCQALGYDWACDPNPDMCKQQRCKFTLWRALWYLRVGCYSEIPPAEGTLCGPGRKCVDGVCQCMTTDCIYKN